MRRSLLTALAVVTAVVATACGGGTGPDGATGAGPGTTAPTDAPDPGVAGPTTSAPRAYRPNLDLTTRLKLAGIRTFTGGDFYDVPAPLPPGRPGDLIRVEPVTRRGLEGVDTLRVMYHSRDVNDRDVAVTGIVAIPHRPPPPGGRPLIAWAHGTSGLAPQCAPSRNDEAFNRSFVDAGYIMTATDYAGLGPNGQRHPYLSGPTEGRSVIDLTRAVGRLGISDLSGEWVVFGHSQGGHAAVFASEQVKTYAPESKLLGVVAMAPVGDLPNLVPYASSPIRGIGVMIVFGLAVEHPELHPADYLTDKALLRASVLDTGCNGDIAQAYATGFEANDLLRADPGVFEPAASILRANNPGQVATAVPELIVHGATDWIVPPDRSKQIFDAQCQLGVTVERKVYDGADHSTILDAANDDVTAFIKARFAHRPARSSCPPRS